jgi:hypothetical protein
MHTATISPQGNAAILFHPEGYTTTGAKLMGRHAAGEGFVQGFAKHAAVERFYSFTRTQQECGLFAQQIQAAGGTPPVVWRQQARPDLLADPGALFVPGPGLGAHAWQRCWSNPRAYNLTGITHTICSDRVMDSLGELLYDWRVIIAQYQALWEELAARRAAATTSHQQRGVPLRGDPFTVFSGYPTRQINKDTQVSVAQADPLATLQERSSVAMTSFAVPLFATPEECQRLLARLQKPTSLAAGTLLADFPPEQHPVMLRTLGWLAKLGIIDITP